MIKRKASAIWNGKGKDGIGSLTTDSKVLDNSFYSFHTRFEQEPGTNPEELIAAAHAGCFTMQFNFFLAERGYDPETIETSCTIHLQDGTIIRSELEVRGKIAGISNTDFESIANEALAKCPVSRALNMEKSVRIELAS